MDESNGFYEGQTKVAEQFRKVFVGGLDVKTSDTALKSYFEKYGEIVDYVVVTHPVSKRPRGFGFVTFKDSESVDAVQNARPHNVDGRVVETKRAMPKEDDGKPESKVKVNKLFIGGIKDDIEENVLKNYFGDFGNITNVHVVTERGSTKKRGFAFVEFDDYDPVDKAVLKKIHYIGSQKMEVKKALSKQQMDELRNSNDRGMRGGRGGGSSYRGGGGGNFRGGNQGYNDYGNGNYGGGNQHGDDSYGGGWEMDSGYDNGPRMGGGYSDFGGDYNDSYNAGPVRGGNQFNQRSQAPYSLGRGGGGRGGGRGGRGGRGGGPAPFRRY